MNKELAQKLYKFQQEVSAIKKDQTNPFFHSQYFDVNTVIEVIRPILNKVGLVVLQPLSFQDGRQTIQTIILDSDTGEFIAYTVVLPEIADAQKMGSAITYFRRYSLVSMLLLQGENDDDGNVASKVAPKDIEPPFYSKKEPTEAELNSLFSPDAEITAGPIRRLEPPAETCQTCGATKVMGKKGLYCKPCFIKWANENKK